MQVIKTHINNSKGTILLIHGTAPQNIDGVLPIKSIQNQLSEKDPTHYIVHSTYKELSEHLNKLGWNTVRYTRFGVYQDEVKNEEYCQTDLKNIMDQLKDIWSELPNDSSKIIFAWSGGSIHALQMPLFEASALIIMGGIATKRTDVIRLRARNESELKEIDTILEQRVSSETDTPRDLMMGVDMPYGRFWDENRLEDNWKYLVPHKNLPTLILHGDRDCEVDVSQAKIWKDSLPDHKITLKIRQGGNHAFGVSGNGPDMQEMASVIDSWLSDAET